MGNSVTPAKSSSVPMQQQQTAPVGNPPAQSAPAYSPVSSFEPQNTTKSKGSSSTSQPSGDLEAQLRALMPLLAKLLHGKGQTAQAQPGSKPSASTPAPQKGQPPAASPTSPQQQTAPPAQPKSGDVQVKQNCPTGALKVNGDCVTTPGGYKICPSGKQEFKIVGPDGKSTRISVDPHVAEGDGGNWDFTKDSSFNLPDGTRVLVHTSPPDSKGKTVTSSLDIVNGADHVAIGNVDKGKGKIGTLDQTGQKLATDFKGDAYNMGQYADDWLSSAGAEMATAKPAK